MPCTYDPSAFLFYNNEKYGNF